MVRQARHDIRARLKELPAGPTMTCRSFSKGSFGQIPHNMQKSRPYNVRSGITDP